MSKQGSAQFTIEHTSAFEYTETAQGSVMLARLSPRQDRGQCLVSFDLAVDPQASIVPFRDAFGNSCHLFNIHRGHRRATVRSRAEVETVDGPVLPDRLESKDWDALAREAENPAFWDFLAPSHFARPCDALDSFADRHGLIRGCDPLATLHTTCAALHESFEYTPGSTGVDSPIEDILESGKGVCQDYTHVMIALGRRWGIPSRYVSGYLHLGAAYEGDAREAASHAWAEFWLPGIGWAGFDPTHNTCANCRHIRLAEGRDYADVAPTRGTVFGGGTERLEVAVSIVDEGDGKTFTAASEELIAHPADGTPVQGSEPSGQQ